MRIYKDIACTECEDVWTVVGDVVLPWVCINCREDGFFEPNEALKKAASLAYQTLRRIDARYVGCEKETPEEVELDNDLIADLKQQLDNERAIVNSQVWELDVRNKRIIQLEGDLENERKGNDVIIRELCLPWYSKLVGWLSRQWDYDIYRTGE